MASDYIYVPQVTDVFLEGANLYYRFNSGNAKVGYTSSTAYTIKVGLYRGGILDDVWVFSSPSLVTSANIQVVSPVGTVLFECQDITQSYDGGYYAEVHFGVRPLNGEFFVTQFQSLEEVLDAFGNELPVIVPGIVVYATASDESPPSPGDNNVVVYAKALMTDPYYRGGTSTTGGGQGTFDRTSYPIPIDQIPVLSAAQSGLVTLFRPSETQIRALSKYLWTNITDFIDNLNKLFVNPMDYMIALNIFPCSPEVGTEREINIGSLVTSITMPPVLSQWYEKDCGEIDIDEFWGSALDYAPNTKISLFLPFIGSVQLNTDEVMNHTLGVKYRIDLLSGQCVAMVTVDGSLYYQYTGECAVAVPLTGSDWSRVYSAAIGAVGTAITGAMGASAAGAMAMRGTGGTQWVSDAARALNAGAAAGQAYLTKGMPLGGASARQSLMDMMAMSMDLAKEAQSEHGENAAENAALMVRRSHSITSARRAETVANTVSQVMSGKYSVNHSGSISGSAGVLGKRTPFVLIEYPEQSLAKNYMHYCGYPANLEGPLSEFSGYTEVEQALVTIRGTDSELSELLDALKAGVYL